jgi:hypothetical protein
VGIRFEGNNKANFSLTVGDEGKASVMNNTLYGIEGNNIILNIDVITHHGGNQASNSDHLANDFINNGQAHFKICYTDVNFVPYSIPMRVNNWGGGNPSQGDIEIEYNNCNTAVQYDYIPYATQSKDCDGIDLEADEPFVSYSPEQFSGAWGPSDCKCNKWLSTASAELGDHYQNEYEEIKYENYLYGQQGLEPISNEVGDLQMTDFCRHLSHVSYSLVKMNDTTIGDVGLRFAEDQLNNGALSEESGVKIFPNPSRDRVNIINESKVDISLFIFNEKGLLVNEDEVSSGQAKVWRNMHSGIYFFKVMNTENGQTIGEHKQVVLE